MSERGPEFGLQPAEAVKPEKSLRERMHETHTELLVHNELQVGDRESGENQPDEGGIMAVFAAEFKGKPSEESVRKLDDKGNLLKLEAFVLNEKGEKTELTYAAASRIGEKSGSLIASISVAYYDADGIPEGGRTIADYKEGKWVYQK